MKCPDVSAGLPAQVLPIEDTQLPADNREWVTPGTVVFKLLQCICSYDKLNFSFAVTSLRLSSHRKCLIPFMRAANFRKIRIVKIALSSAAV